MRIIHTFQWNLQDIIKELSNIKSQGFTHIQLHPMQGVKDNGDEWWKYYQIMGVRIIDNPTGTKEDLKQLTQEAHKIGLKVIQDVVLRHVATNDFNCTIPHHRVDKELFPYLIETEFCCDWECREQLTTRNTGMPMLDYDNLEYLKIVKRFLDELTIECDIDMIRVDQAKHLKLRKEGGQLIKLLSQYNCYGECIDCNSEILDEYCCDMLVGINNTYWDKLKSVAFYESHDTFLNVDGMGYTRNLSEYLVASEYLTLCRNYPNTLFYVRPFSTLWKSDLVRVANNQ